MAQRKSNLKKWWKDAKKEVTETWIVSKQRIKKKKQIRKDVRQQIKKENTFYWYLDRGLRIVILMVLGGVVILMVGNISGIIPNSMSKCSLWILSVLFVLISCQASITVAINDKTPGILKAYFAKLEEGSTVNENILKSNQIPSKIINQKVKMWDWYILELMFWMLAEKVLSSL